jgi:hypothetical protein
MNSEIEFKGFLAQYVAKLGKTQKMGYYISAMIDGKPARIFARELSPDIISACVAVKNVVGTFEPVDGVLPIVCFASVGFYNGETQVSWRLQGK